MKTLLQFLAAFSWAEKPNENKANRTGGVRSAHPQPMYELTKGVGFASQNAAILTCKMGAFCLPKWVHFDMQNGAILIRKKPAFIKVCIHLFL